MHNGMGSSSIVYRQKVSKEEKQKFLLLSVIMVLPLLVICGLASSQKADMMLVLMFAVVLYLPILLLALIPGLINLEWFVAYDDRIEAKCLFYTQNTVYYKDVISIRSANIPLTSRGMEGEFYVFDDGRKDAGSIFGPLSCCNRKKYSFRIYKTPGLEVFLAEKLGQGVIHKAE